MAIEPRNIVCDSPDVFSQLIGVTASTPSGIDASPIYTVRNATVTINGDYDGEVGTAFEDYNYSYSNVTLDAVEQTREGLRDLVAGVFFENYEVSTSKTEVSSFADILFEDAMPPNTFVATQGDIPSASDQTRQPFAPPSMGGGDPLTHVESDGVDVGVLTITNTPPPDTILDLSVSMVFNGPFFRGTIEGSDLEMYFTLSGTINQGHQPESVNEEVTVDASSWGSPDFRDIRGTYGTTSTDENGIEYVWSITIG